MTKAEDLIDSFAATEMYFGNGNGLNKREYFSAMALQGICATFSGSPNAERQAEKVGKTLSETMAVYAVDVADALINALNEKP